MGVNNPITLKTNCVVQSCIPVYSGKHIELAPADSYAIEVNAVIDTVVGPDIPISEGDVCEVSIMFTPKKLDT